MNSEVKIQMFDDLRRCMDENPEYEINILSFIQGLIMSIEGAKHSHGEEEQPCFRISEIEQPKNCDLFFLSNENNEQS
jgi:hypothetical protein